MKTTQVQISKETRKELQKLKITKRESYEEIIKRLIELIKIKEDKYDNKT